jgi:hypothetical protein
VLRRTLPRIVGDGLTGVAGCQLAYVYAVTHRSVGVALVTEPLEIPAVPALPAQRHTP